MKSGPDQDGLKCRIRKKRSGPKSFVILNDQRTQTEEEAIDEEQFGVPGY